MTAATIALTACRAPVVDHRTTDPATLDRAYDLERGHGVGRDYARAAAIYEHLCNEGDGDQAACDELVDAIADARGVTRDLGRVAVIATARCRHGDSVMCVYASLLAAGARGHGPDGGPTLSAAIDNVEHECAAGDARACKIAMLGWLGDDPNALAKHRGLSLTSCRAGAMHSCAELIRDVTACVESRDVAACVDHTLDLWRVNRAADADRVQAFDLVTTACDAGDAIACAALPGRALTSDQACTANDYAGCAALACFGDEPAAALARAHAATADCMVVRAEARVARTRVIVARDSDGANPRRVTFSDRATSDPIELEASAEHDSASWPRIEIHNVGRDRIADLSLCLYAIGSDGEQLARVHATAIARPPIDSRASVVVELEGVESKPPLTSRVVVHYDRVGLSGGDSAFDDPNRCPETLAK